MSFGHKDWQPWVEDDEEHIMPYTVEETTEALHDLAKSGKVRYVGASSK